MGDIRGRFGRAVRSRRNKLGVSQEEFAYMCDLDRTYIGGIERGERNVSLINIEKIAEDHRGNKQGSPYRILFISSVILSTAFFCPAAFPPNNNQRQTITILFLLMALSSSLDSPFSGTWSVLKGNDTHRPWTYQQHTDKYARTSQWKTFEVGSERL